MDVPVQLTSGAALQAPKDLIPYLTNAQERSVLFIDEIHRLPKAVEEYLYTAMEDYRVDIVHGEGTNARTLNLWLKPFTLIGATTRAGLLSAPLRDRFQIREHLDFYTLDELTAIVRRSAQKLQVSVDDDSAAEIARRSRGTPRVANNLSALGPRLRHQQGRRTRRDRVNPRRPGRWPASTRWTGSPGSQVSGNDYPCVWRRTGRRRGHRPYDEYRDRHAGR